MSVNGRVPLRYVLSYDFPAPFAPKTKLRSRCLQSTASDQSSTLTVGGTNLTTIVGQRLLASVKDQGVSSPCKVLNVSVVKRLDVDILSIIYLRLNNTARKFSLGETNHCSSCRLERWFINQIGSSYASSFSSIRP